MILKRFYDTSTGFSFLKNQCECSVHSCSCPWTIPPYLRSTFSSWSFSHLWFASFKSFSIWRLCCLNSIWKLLSWRLDSFWEQKSLVKSYFLHSVRHCEQLFWPFSSHFVMHSVWNTWPHGVEDTLLTGVNDSRQVEQAQAVEFIASFFFFFPLIFIYSQIMQTEFV